ncbi:uncharacterized protein METZ01_LOCUS302472, partial [marine metagenome]
RWQPCGLHDGVGFMEGPQNPPQSSRRASGVQQGWDRHRGLHRRVWYGRDRRRQCLPGSSHRHTAKIRNPVCRHLVGRQDGRCRGTTPWKETRRGLCRDRHARL